MGKHAVLVLAVASILLLACAADELASAQKYDKKHEKYGKPEYKAKHTEKEYKPEYKEYRPEHKEYKPDGYKPDGYKPDHYSPGYGKEYKHYAPSPAYPPYGGYGGYEHKPYEHGYSEYAPPSYGYESYGEPSPYDGGYWGGLNGRQIIHLQAIYPESLLNTSLVDPESKRRRTAVPDNPCSPESLDNDERRFGFNPGCDGDFGLICAWRHHKQEQSYGSDYASGKYGPIFETEPTTPVAIGKGWAGFDFKTPPLKGIDLVTFNKHQKGYNVGDITGFLTFVEGAQNCHPLLDPNLNPKVNFYDHYVPTYLIFGKVKLPVDPAILVPLGGLLPPQDNKKRRAKPQSVDTSDYKTTPEGTKYKIDKEMAYVYNEKDDTLCGLSLVARGAVSLVVDPPGADNTVTFSGTLQWPLVWSDFVTTLPLLVQDPIDQPARRDIGGDNTQVGINIGDGTIIQVLINVIQINVNVDFSGGGLDGFLGRLLDRVGSICKANSDIPWITPGSITLDVTPVP